MMAHGLIRKGSLFIALLAVLGSLASCSDKPKKKSAEPTVVSITLPPPPPPLPPPPPPLTEPPPPTEEKMVEQEPVANEEPPPEAPAAPPAEALGTNVQGNGPDMGLRAGGGNGGGNGRIGGTGGGSKWGWYAGGVQSVIADALRRHPATRNATMAIKVRIWPDATGRIIRAQLVESTGNAATDEALKNQILTGLQLKQGPPADMPLPIVLRVNSRKP